MGLSHCAHQPSLGSPGTSGRMSTHSKFPTQSRGGDHFKKMSPFYFAMMSFLLFYPSGSRFWLYIRIAGEVLLQFWRPCCTQTHWIRLSLSGVAIVLKIPVCCRVGKPVLDQRFWNYCRLRVFWRACLRPPPEILSKVRGWGGVGSVRYFTGLIHSKNAVSAQNNVEFHFKLEKSCSAKIF